MSWFRGYMLPRRSRQRNRLGWMAACFLLASTASVAFGQAPWQEHVTDDPTPIPFQIGDERLSIPANCVLEIPPFLDVHKRTENYHSIQFFWPSLTCLTRERLADFRNPGTPDLIRILTSGVNGPSTDPTPTFGIFIGSVEGISRFSYDAATFALDYDDELEMHVRHTVFIDQKIALFVDRDQELPSITRFLRCGDGDWYCRWFGQFCGLDVQVAFNRVQLPNAKAIYDDTERLFCETWRGKPG